MPRQEQPGAGCYIAGRSRFCRRGGHHGELARHALPAGLLAETIRHSLMAGNDALAIFAVRVALPHYETAWQLTEQQGWPETISGADKQCYTVVWGEPTS